MNVDSVCLCVSCCLMSEVRQFILYYQRWGKPIRVAGSAGSTFRLMQKTLISFTFSYLQFPYANRMFFLYITRLPNFCGFAFCVCVHTSKSARLYSVCASRLMFLFFCLPSISLQLGSLPCFSVPSLLPCSSSLRWDEKAAADSRRSSCVCPHVHVWGIIFHSKECPCRSD